MSKPSFDYIPSPNFSNRTNPITALVIHYTGSNSIEAPIRLFKDKNSKMSCHYLIGRDGRMVQMVKEEDIAWHAGRSAMYPNEKPPREINVNKFSIGIELVATMDSGFTSRQLASLYSLLEILVSRYAIHPDRMVGHCHISPGRKHDPDGIDNQFPWPKARHVAQVVYNGMQKQPV